MFITNNFLHAEGLMLVLLAARSFSIICFMVLSTASTSSEASALRIQAAELMPAIRKPCHALMSACQTCAACQMPLRWLFCACSPPVSARAALHVKRKHGKEQQVEQQAMKLQM